MNLGFFQKKKHQLKFKGNRTQAPSITLIICIFLLLQLWLRCKLTLISLEHVFDIGLI